MRYRPRVWIAAGLVLTVALAWGARALWRAHQALRASERQIAAEARIAFADTTLDRAAPAGWEMISAPSGFRDAAILNGRFFVVGGAGVFEYDAEGRPIRQFRAGLELPAAPAVAAAIGIAGGAPGPELWIATSGEGALAFDGTRFRQLRATQARFRKLTAVLPLSTGRIVFGTEKAGLVVFDGRALAPFHESLSALSVTALAGDEANLWIGTQDAGVVHWHAGEIERIGENDGLPDPRVSSIQVDGDTAYAAGALGVAEIRAGKVQRVLAQGFTVQALLKAADFLLIGTLGDGLLRIPLAARAGPGGLNERGAKLQSVQKILSIDGAAVAVTVDGVYRAESRTGEWAPLLADHDSRLADRNISAIAPDDAGRVWIGYFDRGLDILSRDAPRADHIEDDIVFCVNRIVHDRARERAAAATANGLVLFSSSGTRRQTLTKSDGLIANHVTDVLFRPEGDLVAGTPAGVSFIEGARISSVYAFHGLVNNHVYALGQVGARTLVGTLGGLSVLESGLASVRFTTANSGFRHNWITAIQPTGNDLFIGTYGGGIFHMGAGGAWEPFNELPAAFEVNPNAMAASDRAVYAGTLDRGLAAYDRHGGRWRWIVRGLPSMNVTAVAVEGGSVFVGTDNGLVRISEEILLK